MEITFRMTEDTPFTCAVYCIGMFIQMSEKRWSRKKIVSIRLPGVKILLCVFVFFWNAFYVLPGTTCKIFIFSSVVVTSHQCTIYPLERLDNPNMSGLKFSPCSDQKLFVGLCFDRRNQVLQHGISLDLHN